MAIRSQLDLRAVQNAYGNHMQNALSKAGAVSYTHLRAHET